MASDKQSMRIDRFEAPQMHHTTYNSSSLSPKEILPERRPRSQPHPSVNKKLKDPKTRNKSAAPTYSLDKGSSIPNISEHGNAFPKKFTYSGYLDIKSRNDTDWTRRYFVLSNNFLLRAATPHAQKLDYCYPLEGSEVDRNSKSSNKTSGNLTFELFTRKKLVYFRAGNTTECQKWKRHIAKASKLKIKDIYRFIHTLGTSDTQMNKVVAAKHRMTNEDAAIKIVDKRMCDGKLLKQEIQILKRLDNKYIVKLYDIFETKKFLYIVMELCSGGELFDQIADLDDGGYTVGDCCHVLHQIANGVQYMHEMGIVHRDLKPENVLCVEKDSIKRVKLADFGMSKIVHNKKQKAEITRSKLMQTNISQCILKEDVDFEDEDWEHVDDEVKRVVAGLLQKDPSKRLTTDSVLQLTFKVTAKNMSRGWKKSRVKFKKHVTERKLLRSSVDIINKRMSNNRHRVGASQDDYSQYRNTQKMSDSTRKYKAMGGRRGSKTTEQFDLNLPMTQRTSLVANFMTDDDMRKKKQREKKENENKKYEDQQYTAELEGIDEDDQKESQ